MSEYQFRGDFWDREWSELPSPSEVRESVKKAIRSDVRGVVSKIEIDEVEITTIDDWAPAYTEGGFPKAFVHVRWTVDDPT